MFFFAAALGLACTDATETDDSGFSTLSCAAETPAPYPVGTGVWSALTAEALYNHCETEFEKGPHIHLGRTDLLDFVEDGDCLHTVANENFPADMVGLHDGTDFELEGSFLEAFGICDLQIDATFAGTLTDADTFSYTFHLAVWDLNTHCAVAVGKGKDHTYKQLPCELSWTGTAVRGDNGLAER
jgi:hypothetical protein